MGTTDDKPAGRMQAPAADAAAAPAQGPATGAAGADGGVLRRWLLARRDTAATNVADTAKGASRDVALPPVVPPSLERIIAGALGRAAGRVHLHALAEQVTPRGLTLAELMETLPDGGLISLVEGPGEALGVIALDSAMLASLIEIEAMGRLRSGCPVTRRPTRTDATIAAVFINHALDEIGTAAVPLPAAACWTGYRYASYLEDARPLPLMLDETGYRSVAVDLRIGKDGLRGGKIMIALPGLPRAAENARGEAAMPGDATPGAPPAPPPPKPLASLAEAAARAPIPIQAVLARRRVTLRELRALQPGSLLALPGASLGRVAVEARGGQPLASGRLGEKEGCYAVCIHPAEEQKAAGNAGPSPLPGSNGPRQPPFDPSPAPISEPPMGDLGEPDAFRRQPDDDAPSMSPLPDLPAMTTAGD